MTSPFLRRASFAGLTFALAIGCGSRSNLPDAPPVETGGSGGAGATGGTTSSGGTTTTTTTTTSAPFTCQSLLVRPTSVLPPTSGVVSKPRTTLIPPQNDVALAARVAILDDPNYQVVLDRVDAFGDWPPSHAGPTQLDFNVGDYEMGPGPDGPVLVSAHPFGSSTLFTSLFPVVVTAGAPFNDGDHALFAVAVQDRYFWAFSNDSGEYNVLSVASYQPNNLPQTEQPLVCTTGLVKGGAIPLGQAFLAAFAIPSDENTTCPINPAQPGSRVAVERYDSPPDLSLLQHSEGVRHDGVQGEALLHLAVAPAPFGAWVVYQYDGATAEVPPPIQGFRVDPKGQYAFGYEILNLGMISFIPSEVAAAAMGDDLAIAWIDSIDPSAPLIVIQLVHADGTPGPATSIPTNDAWFSGDLRLLGSADGQHLLLSWTASNDQGSVALARLDCAQGI